MESVLLSDVLNILKGFLFTEEELVVEKYDRPINAVYIFSEPCGFLCSWQEEEQGFRRNSSEPFVSGDEILEKILGLLRRDKKLLEFRNKRRTETPGYHLESVLLNSVLSSLLEKYHIQSEEVDVSYAYMPGDEPERGDLRDGYTWVTIHTKETKEVICRWLENQSSKLPCFNDEGGDRTWESPELATEELVETSCASRAVSRLLLEKLHRFSQENSALKEKNEKLKLRVAKYKFAPSGKKMLELEKHFHELSGSQG
nr:hypothetical protein MarFTME_220 [Marseillevirus futianmevirus]